MRRRARMGGLGQAHTKQNDRPEPKYLKIFPPKSSGFVFPEPHFPRPANPRKPFTTLRGAPRRA